MRFVSFASSSSGNCYFVSEGETCLLIDAGISMRRIVRSLDSINVKPSQVSGVLITHEHRDHICGLTMLTKYHGIDIYATENVAKNICSAVRGASGHIKVIPMHGDINIGRLTVKAFPTMHDTEESVGYRICGDRSKLAVATDLGIVTDDVVEGMRGVDFAVLESNHDVAMLKSGSYPYHLKKRILSNRGHLSNEASSVLAKTLALSGTKQVLLAHLSKENNTPELAKRIAARALLETNAAVEVAPYDEMSCTYYF